MIGLDTNVVVRYLAQDDPAQSALAARLFESLSTDQPGFISHVVLAETVWVLESCYATDASAVAKVVETLLRTDALVVERTETVWRALRHFLRSRGDFVDTLVTELARAAGCDTIYSFDRGASKRAGMTLLR